MHSKSSWKDNVFIDRFRRTLKYQEVYLRLFHSVSVPRQSIRPFLAVYNSRRPQNSNDDLTPNAAYFGLPSINEAT